MNILVTGGSGFIGRSLCKALVERRDEVIVLSEAKGPLPREVQFIQGDILDQKVFEGLDVDLIYHLAANPSVWYGNKEPLEDFRINALGALHVLEFARKVAARVVFTSSIALYDGHLSQEAYTENDIQANSFMSLSKSVAEKYISQYYATFGVQSIILRLAFVYGPGVTRGPIADARKGERMFSHPHSVMDFIHVKDVVRALLLAGDTSIEHDVFNIGSGIGTSITELLNIMKSSLQGNTEGEKKHLVLDISKAKEFGWEPEISLEEGVCEE